MQPLLSYKIKHYKWIWNPWFLPMHQTRFSFLRKPLHWIRHILFLCSCFYLIPDIFPLTDIILLIQNALFLTMQILFMPFYPFHSNFGLIFIHAGITHRIGGSMFPPVACGSKIHVISPEKRIGWYTVERVIFISVELNPCYQSPISLYPVIEEV